MCSVLIEIFLHPFKDVFALYTHDTHLSLTFVSVTGMLHDILCCNLLSWCRRPTYVVTVAIGF